MNRKEYLMPDGERAVFEYDHDGVGKVTLEAMDVLMGMITDRPRGEWIVNMPNYKSICSVCGAKETEFIYGTEMWYGLGESNFCPHCGARMKGAEDEVR